MDETYILGHWILWCVAIAYIMHVWYEKLKYFSGVWS